MKTWVFVHAHPDDETLWTGALIATAAAQGDRVIVITCTRGERGEVIPAELQHLEGNHQALAEYRTGELQAALAALGPNIEHHFLGNYQDSGMVWLVPPVESGNAGTSTGGVAGPDPDAVGGFANVPLDEPASHLAEYLRQLGSDNIVLVTYEADGGYGHPDHVRAHQVAQRALDLISSSSSCAQTQDLTAPHPSMEFWQVTKPGEPHDVEVPVAPVLPQLTQAMQAYATQIQNVQFTSEQPGQLGTFALSNGVPIPLRATENYLVNQLGRECRERPVE